MDVIAIVSSLLTIENAFTVSVLGLFIWLLTIEIPRRNAAFTQGLADLNEHMTKDHRELSAMIQRYSDKEIETHLRVAQILSRLDRDINGRK